MSSRTTHGRAEMEDTPSDWRIDLFSNAVEVNPTRSLVAGEEYPYVPMDALSTDSPKVAYVEKRTWNRSSGTRFQNGDVLFARITPSAENGKTALVDFLEEGGRGVGSTEFIVLSPRRGGVEDSKRWGHCTCDRRLVFNWQLSALPRDLAEYVVMHEVSHLSEFNHNGRFRTLLFSFCPDFREKEQALRNIMPWTAEA